MNWNRHSELEGSHAILSASKYHWINYTDEKLIDSVHNLMAAAKGTEDHDFASRCIKRGQKLPNKKQTLNMFVNDAIGFKMESEQVLYYSENCYGTADAISFRKNVLRIHDLKTGVTPAHMEQLLIYAALFCLEYRVKPTDIKIELCIYQNDEVFPCTPDAEDILPIMDKIVNFDKLIRRVREEEAA